MKIKKDDNVIIITGKDKGKTGPVLRVFPKLDKVLVENINIKKIHKRARKQGEKGKVIEQAAPVHISNVALLDPKSKKPTRLGAQIKDGKKLRIAKKSGQTV